MAVFTAIGTAAATAAFGAAAAGTAAFTFVSAATAAGLQIATGIAVSLIAKATSGSSDAGSNFSVQGKLQSGGDVPRSINFGWSATAGSSVYHNTFGDAGTYFTHVIALGDAPIRELREVFPDGSGPVTLLDGEALASYGSPVAEYRKGGRDHLWLKFYDGTQTVADSFLTGTVSSAEFPYGSDRVGVGVPYVIATSRAPERSDGDEQPIFNGFPKFKFATYGLKLYDISRDSTAGGSGSHRWDNPATWGGDGDFLPPVQIYNILRGISVGGAWLYGLQGVSAARLPQANWVAQINKSRTLIGGPDGDEATYRSGGEVQVGAQINTAIDAMLTACQGRLVESGGSYKIFVGAADAPVMSFTDDDILSSEEQSFSPFFGLSDSINGVAATYPNPAEAWVSKPAPSLFRDDLEVLDGDRRLMASVALDMVPYAGQVQRLMKSAVAEARRARRHTLTMGPEFWPLTPGNVVSWTSERNGYISKWFRVDGVVDKANLDVILDITEVDPADYDWDQGADYTPVIDGSIELVGPVPLPMTGWAVYPDTIFDQNSKARRPSIRVAYASGLADVLSVRVQVRTSGETLPFFDGEVPYGTPWATQISAQLTAATDYEVRGIFIRESGSLSAWSSWLSVTTDNIRLTSEDFSDAVNETRISAMQQIAELSEYLNSLGSTVANQDASNREEIKAKFGKAAALVVQESLARADEFGSLSSSITAVVAQYNDVSASGLFSMVAEAAPDGFVAKITLAVRGSIGGEVSLSAISLLVDSEGNSQIIFDADRVIFTGRAVSTNGGTFIDFTTGAVRFSTGG